MDFTLLNSQRKLSEFSKNSINDFAKHKIGFTIASARSFTTLKPLLNGVSLLPIVEFNGGYLTNFRTEKPIKIVDLPKKVSKGLFQLSEDLNFFPVVSTYGSERAEVFPEKTQNSGMKWYFNVNVRLTTGKQPRFYSSHDELSQKKVITLTYIGNQDQIDRLPAQMPHELKKKVFLHQYENLYNPGSFSFN
jgi:hydroxymethylpyrimidine pyrophosphatase-like HAD family hydrolase